jgi:uncharacterized protein (DUF302 family)
LPPDDDYVQASNNCGTPIMSDDGLITVASRFSARETMDRLLTALPARNMTVFARIDHAAGAAAVGLSLRPTEVVIFGNPKGGTVLMQDDQRAGLDLPLKVLVWEGDAGKAFVTYSDPAWTARRYSLGHPAAIEAITAVLKAIVAAATA